MNTKKCYVCGKSLPLDQFNRNHSKPDGLATECKSCKAKKDKEYRERNSEKVKAKKHQYYLENKGYIVARVNAYIDENRGKHNEWGKNAKEKNKLEVFSYYCRGDVKCQRCGETEIGILTIDHMDGNGSEHRREVFGEGARTGGSRFYFWLKKNSYPEGFQVLCFNCQFRKRNKELKPESPTHLQKVRARYARKVKLECLDGYGGPKCPCGEQDVEVLTLDHVNDDGAEHRRKTGARGYNFYIMLRKNGFPSEPPLQVLCLNCQIRKRNRKYDEERKSRQANSSDGAAVVA